MKILVFLALGGAFAVGISARAGMIPPIDCPGLLGTAPALGEHYGKFSAYLERGYATYLRLSRKARACIAEFDVELATLPKETSTVELRERLAAAPGLSVEDRADLFEILGLGEAVVGAALEKYRRNYQYLFWSDHSIRHMLEIVERSRELSVSSPKAFRAYFAPAFENPAWREYIDRAIRLHDSRMSVGRTQHAEELLDWDEATFPAHWDTQAKVTASVLAMLHSKSTVPYALLANWKTVLVEEILPKLVREGELTEMKARTIRTALDRIDTDTMAKAASWIRIADAARPIGSELRNSMGQSFVLSKDERNAFLRTPKGDAPIPRSQFAIAYGQLALGNFRLRAASHGKLVIEFPFLIQGPYRKVLRRDLARFDVIRSLVGGTAGRDLEGLGYGREARAVAEILASILGDFPPELLAKMRLELK